MSFSSFVNLRVLAVAWALAISTSLIDCASLGAAELVPAQPQLITVPPAAPGQHPLIPALTLAENSLAHIKNDIKDYTCDMIKEERIGNKLGEKEYMSCKIRHEPFSVYMKFNAPEDVKNREVIYVQGANGGNMIAHEGHGLKARLGWVSLKPDSILAMANSRYPITEIGFKNLTMRLIEVAESDKKYGECTVNFNDKAKVGDRPMIAIQVIHPTPRANFKFNEARVYLDAQLNIPVHYESYDWPAQKGGTPLLLEKYTYYNIQTNVGLTNADFDPNNPAYNLPPK